MTISSNQLPKAGFLRIWHIVGNKERNLSPIMPVSRSTFLAKVKSGEFPQPVKLGERMTAWRAEDIYSLIEKLSKEA